MKCATAFLAMMVMVSPTYAVAEPSAPASLIRQMTGCFSVVFHYLEDGTHDKDFPPVIEKAELVSESPLVINRTLIIHGQHQPHWTEEWTELDDGKWRQTVTGPFGDLRYSCEGPWTLNQWNCLADQAAKPRRDSDRPYDHLRRQNTLQINENRWIHIQTNQKITTDQSVYSVEIGWNTYERVDQQQCL